MRGDEADGEGPRLSMAGEHEGQVRRQPARVVSLGALLILSKGCQVLNEA